MAAADRLAARPADRGRARRCSKRRIRPLRRRANRPSSRRRSGRSSSSCYPSWRRTTSGTSSSSRARADTSERRSIGDQVRHRAGRRPAVEGPGQVRAVRHRRAEHPRRDQQEPMTAGAVAAVLVPNRPTAPARSSSSASSTSRRCRASTRCSAASSRASRSCSRSQRSRPTREQRPTTRVEIKNVTIRDTPPPVRDARRRDAGGAGAYRA